VTAGDRSVDYRRPARAHTRAYTGITYRPVNTCHRGTAAGREALAIKRTSALAK
jgi:hypothetical protein